MNLEVALVLTVGSIAGSLLITQLWQMNYFKKEKFKFDLKRQNKIDNIELKKLKKDMGITGSTKKQTEEKGLLDQVKDLDLNKIQDLLSYVQKPDEYDDDETDNNDWTDDIITLAKNNPELVQKFLGNISGSKQEQKEIKYLGD